MKLLVTLLVFCVSSIGFTQILRINDSSFPKSSYGPEELIKKVLISSSCSTADNFTSQVTGAPNNLTTKSYGYFKRPVGSTFPFEDGVVLTTGRAYSAGNILESDTVDYDNGDPGDSDLEAALGQTETQDATFIKFNFTPLVDTINFRFIMASEEYDGTFECEYADSFAFLLREVEAKTYANLAVLPDGTPVSVKNINDADICRANTQYFQGYNVGNTNYDGRTVALTASSVVTPGVTYEIKLVVADQGDSAWDSAIFIEGGSFNIGGDLGIDHTIVNGNPGCLGTDITLNANLSVAGATFNWFKDDTLIAGETKSKLDVSINGTYSFKAILTSGCVATDEVVIEFTTPPAIEKPPNDFNLCDNALDGDDTNGFVKFDLSTKIPEILGYQLTSNYTIKFFYDQASAHAGVVGTEITTPIQNTSNPQFVFVRIENKFNMDCFGTTSLQLIVNPLLVVDLEDDYKICVTTNGTVIVGSLVIDTGLSDVDYIFLWKDSSKLIVSTGSVYIPTEKGSYTLEVLDGKLPTECAAPVKVFTVTETEPPKVTVEISSELFANMHVVKVVATGSGNYEYSIDQGLWQNTDVFLHVTPGRHIVKARDLNGCAEDQAEIYVIGYPKFFTPNGDGYHDRWNIAGMTVKSSAKIYIFDRYGKLLKQISPTGKGWDGTYNGERLPSSDYWFVLDYNDLITGKINQLRANFTLKK